MKMSECSITIVGLLGVTLLAVRPAVALQPLATFVAAAESQAVDAAEANATVAQREAEADAATWKLAPTLLAQASYTRNQYEAVARFPAGPTGETREAVILPQNQRELVLRADLPLVDVGAWARASSANATAEAARERRAKSRSDVARRVADAWFAAAAAEGLVDATGRAVSAAEESQRIVAVKREAGRATELEAKRAEAELESRRGAVADARLSLVVAQRRLSTLSGISPSKGGPALPSDDGPEAPLSTWEARAVDTPDLRAARAEERAQGRSRDAVRAALLPSVSAFAQEKFTNAVGFGQQPFYAVGVVATLKLDGSVLPQARTQAAALELARVRARRTIEESRDRVHEAWQTVETRREKRRSAVASLAASQTALGLSRERFSAGQGTLLDVSLAERDVLAAEANAIDATARLGFARVDLRLATGLSPAEALADLRRHEERP